MDPNGAAESSSTASTSNRKHPSGLYTLFFTEMWERFSYYGMRALLVLFMVDAIQNGGLGFTDKTATAIYGLYTALVYLLAVPGGWAADRLLGAQKSVWYGGIVIAMGHFTLAIPHVKAFFIGLLLVVLGTGLLKPNVSAIVGALYPEGGARRDAGFTIFYMGINLGAAIGPLICSTLGEKLNWHYGFGAAGIGMTLGLIQFALTSKNLGEAGRHPSYERPANPDGSAPTHLDRAWYVAFGGLALVLLLTILGLTETLHFDPVVMAKYATYFIVGIGVVYISGIFLFGQLSRQEKRHTVVLVALLIASAIFWSGFEQAGSSLNLFAERFTDRVLDFNQFEIPAGWFQSLNPVFIIIFSPVFASIWVMLGRRQLDPSIPAKFALGLLLLGCGFLVLLIAAYLVAERGKVLPTWLISTYLLHTWGELCLSPVGLSAVTKLAPKRFVGQMMGLWFLASALGNLIAGLIAGRFVGGSNQMIATLWQVVAIAGGSGLILLLCAKPLRKLIGNIR